MDFKQLAGQVEALSAFVLGAADKASEVLDKVAEILEDLADDDAAEQPAREAGGTETTSPLYMYEYLRQSNPRMYNNPRVEAFLMDDTEQLTKLYERQRMVERVRKEGRFA